MYFVLPGFNGKPVETLRYESIRQAIQDYELLRLVDGLLPAEKAHRLKEESVKLIFSTALHDFAKLVQDGTVPTELYSTNPGDYICARNVLLRGLAESNQPQIE